MPFGKHPDFIVRQEDPFNGGPPLKLLRRHPITPSELFFVRNHAPVPEIDPAAYRLRVGGLVERPLELSLEELRTDFPRQTVEATLQCAGNRRDDLMAVAPIPGEVPWGAEALSHGVWTGVPLGSILEAAGATPRTRHAAFTGLDRVTKGAESCRFGGSIPLPKAWGPEVLLAFELNGEPLPPAHGFPLRAVVPGYIGARSVKWLGRIELRAEPSDNPFQARAYKLFPPGSGPQDADWGKGLTLGELSVTAAICSPETGERLPAGAVRVEGYALAGGGRRIERVDLSADGGRSWETAALSGTGPGCWCLWEVEVELRPGRHRLAARAWDSAANTQPESPVAIWNFKGYMSNAWHRVDVEAV